VFNARVQAAAVTLFVLIIAAVIAVLLYRVDRDAAPSNGPSAQASDDLDSAAKDPVGAVSLVAGKGDLVLRVKAGSCGAAGGPKLELSDNRGRTFHQVLVPQIDDGSGVSASSPKVRAIVFAEANSAVSLTVGAADAKCTVHPYTTTDGGVTWTQKSGAVKKWYVDPGTGLAVAPSGPVDAGCKGGGIVSLAPVTKSMAKAFCADGTIRSTIDKGVTWTSVGTLPRVSAAIFTGPNTGYAAASTSSCKSRIHTTVNGGATWTPRGCVVKGFVVPGLTGTDKRLVAGGPGGVRLSTDSGATWKPSKMK
jgi:hypothetical protein